MDVVDGIRKHPWFTAILVLGAVGGALLSWQFGPADMSPARRIVGGIIAGVGIALTIILTRIMGAFQHHSDE